MPYKIYLTPSARERLEVSVITASSYVEEENFVYKVFLFTEGLANETPNKHVFLHKLNDIQQIEEIEHRPVEDEEVESSGDCLIATAC